MVKSRKVSPTVKVTYISTLDSEIRIANAIDLLLAAGYPNEDRAVHTDENIIPENGSSENDHKRDFAG